jgi:hypothetical protein
MHVFPRREDFDFAKGIQVKQVSVTERNRVRPTVHRNLKELAVLGVAAYVDGIENWNDLAGTHKSRDELLPDAALKIAIESRTTHYLDQFEQGCVGPKHIALLRPRQCPSGR